MMKTKTKRKRENRKRLKTKKKKIKIQNENEIAKTAKVVTCQRKTFSEPKVFYRLQCVYKFNLP